MYATLWCMRRVALFLTDQQVRKAKSLGKEIDAPWAAVVRQAIDFYFAALKESGITPKLTDGRVSRSKLNSPRSSPRPKTKVRSSKP